MIQLGAGLGKVAFRVENDRELKGNFKMCHNAKTKAGTRETEHRGRE